MTLTQSGATYPNVSSWPNFDTAYFIFLAEFNASDPIYGGGTILNTLKPEALKKIFNGLAKDECEN